MNALFAKTCDHDKELVFSCGYGITACIVMLACQISYENSLKVYDGSWTKWADRNNLKNIMQQGVISWLSLHRNLYIFNQRKFCVTQSYALVGNNLTVTR